MRAVGSIAATLLLAALGAAAAHAADAPDDPAGICAQQDESLRAAVQFPAIRVAALEVRKQLCKQGATRKEILDSFPDFVAEIRALDWFEPYGGFGAGEDPLQQVLIELGKPEAGPPTMGIVGPASDDEALDVAGVLFAPANWEQCSMHAAIVAGGSDCGGALREFADYYNFAQNTYASHSAMVFASGVRQLGREWDAYLDNGRGFTPLELLVNSYLFKRNEKSYFTSPPDIQWIVLHPGLIIENVPAAVDGENTKEALMVEILGASWWRQDKWYLPNGGSLIAAYADRPGVKDLGYGIALHFRGRFSVGYTRHKGHGGLLISYDLLKLVQDKQKVLKELKP